MPAATCVVLRPSAEGAAGPPEVFLVRRHQHASFMAGACVFPGGRVDETDGSADDTWCDGLDAARAHWPDLEPAEAIAYHVAAMRELFEEAGVLLARDASGRFVTEQPDDEMTARLTARSSPAAGTSPSATATRILSQA